MKIIVVFFSGIFLLLLISFLVIDAQNYSVLSDQKTIPTQTIARTPTYAPHFIPTPTSRPVEINNSQPLYFNDYPCTEDCSGHEAGYNWAEENDIQDIDDCGGNSDSFIEGCQSYIEENYTPSDEEAQDY